MKHTYAPCTVCLCFIALRHSPSKRKSIVDRQKSLVGGNSTLMSHDVTNVTEAADTEQGETFGDCL